MMITIKSRCNCFFCLLVLLISVSCSDIKEIRVGEARKIDVISLNNNILTLDILLPIENPNSFRLKVKDGDLKVMLGKNTLGKVKQMNALIIPGKSTKEYTLRVTIEITDLKGSLLSAFSLLSGKTPELSLTGTIKARSLFYNKTFKVENYPLSK
jgi:LEA14-like dessication related protein